jgi:hypothetical protein
MIVQEQSDSEWWFVFRVCVCERTGSTSKGKFHLPLVQTVSEHPFDVMVPEELKFSHQDFIDRLKNPKAADIVQSLKMYARLAFDACSELPRLYCPSVPQSWCCVCIGTTQTFA